MPDVKILNPTSVKEAVSSLAEHGDEAKIIAGGTALVIMLRNRLVAPSVLVNLGRVENLRYVRHEPGTGLRIGALTTIREAEVSRLVREKNPTLAQTFGEVANVRVRNAATVGGNLSEADYASDPPSVLVAMRARVKASSPRGEREIPLTDLFRGFYETSLAQDEVLTELIVPDLPPTVRSAFIKFVTRSSEDRPCVAMAAVMDMNGIGTCKDLGVVAGAVAATPQELESVEAMARGQRLTDKLIDDIAEAYSSGVEPLSDIRGSEWYRKQVIRVLVRRVIRKALASQEGRA
ncbi:MAG: FAD binding domain-containing protein [Candidatus Methylomirabilales bacterium]